MNTIMPPADWTPERHAAARGRFGPGPKSDHRYMPYGGVCVGCGFGLAAHRGADLDVLDALDERDRRGAEIARLTRVAEAARLLGSVMGDWLVQPGEVDDLCDALRELDGEEPTP